MLKAEVKVDASHTPIVPASLHLTIHQLCMSYQCVDIDALRVRCALSFGKPVSMGLRKFGLFRHVLEAVTSVQTLRVFLALGSRSV